MSMPTRTKVINFMGGPGVGKSTAAAIVYGKLKQAGISCEIINEHAKDVTWEENFKLLENQIHLFSEQFRKQFRLIDKVQYIITDSPLILNSIYFEAYALKSKTLAKFSNYFKTLTEDLFDASFLEFNNVNYLIERSESAKYDTQGRNQTLDESIKVDMNIRARLHAIGVTYTVVNIDTNWDDIANEFISKHRGYDD
jgi:deoxyadenosine/deoxycytidine kinase